MTTSDALRNTYNGKKVLLDTETRWMFACLAGNIAPDREACHHDSNDCNDEQYFVMTDKLRCVIKDDRTVECFDNKAKKWLEPTEEQFAKLDNLLYGTAVVCFGAIYSRLSALMKIQKPEPPPYWFPQQNSS